MTLASLPVLDCYIAFNPTASGTTLTTAVTQALPASGASNSYWTNVSKYVKDFQTKSGRQHFLDRIESATIQMTVNNRTGYFLNGNSPSGAQDGNGTGFVLAPSMPIAVTATWSATTYPVYWGLTTAIEERVGDQLNSDLMIQASDQTAYLARKYAVSNKLYSTYANSAAATAWYRCDFDAASTITCKDSIGSADGTWDGPANTPQASAVSFPTYGALLYDLDSCVDLANGSGKATGYIQLPQTSYTGMDLWFLGATTDNNTIAVGSFINGSGIAYDATLMIHSHQTAVKYVPHAGGSTTYAIVSGVNAPDDGFWHHLGWYVHSNTLYVYQDGVSVSVSALDGAHLFISASSPGVGIGADINNYPNLPAYIDEIVISGQGGTGYAQPAVNEILNRYVAGGLLQHGYPKYTVYSGDRIAEILVIAGYGTISGGTIVPTANTLYINGSAYTTYGSSSNGFIQVEPYYWDSPTSSSTCFDLILQVCDTDVGIFFQAPDGTFQYFDQSKYGSWSWNSTTNTGTWTPSYTTPSGDHVWTDDASSSYAYYGPSLQILRDDADTWTTVKITPQAGTDQIYENTANEARWGYTTLTKSGTVHPSLNLALSTANYLGYIFNSPLPRVGNVELRSETSNGGNMTALLGTKIGDPVTFKRTSPNASTSGTYPSVKGQISADMVVESISHDFAAEPGYWHSNFVLSPYEIRA